MDLNDYQQEAAETAIYPGPGGMLGLLYVSLGLAGEAGEVANKVKKVLRDNDGVPSQEVYDDIANELGDVLWYLAMAARECGFDLGVIAQINLNKLSWRAERGKLGGTGDTR